YLDEIHPEPPFLPRDPLTRAKVRAFAQLIACDIHPLNNTSPLRYLKNELGQDQAKIDRWYHHWILVGFEALEPMVGPGPYAFGSTVTLADICLVPQVYNARRLKVPLDRFPKLVAIDAACMKLAAFERARPENQPDAEGFSAIASTRDRLSSDDITVTSRHVIGVVGGMTGALLSFSAMAVSIRELAATLSIMEILAVRSGFGLVVMAALTAARADLRATIFTRQLPLHFFRNL